MERRNFIKNIGILAVMSHIGITAAKPNEIIYDLILKTKEGELKMKLLEISTDYESNEVYFEAIINHWNIPDFSGIIEFVYKPDPLTTLSGKGC